MRFMTQVAFSKLPKGHRVVVHPLDDKPEQKRDASGLGRIPMTPAVRWSLIALRAYLIVMTFLIVWRVLEMTGALR